MVLLGYARLWFALDILFSCCLCPFCSRKRIPKVNTVSGGIGLKVYRSRQRICQQVQVCFTIPVTRKDENKIIHKKWLTFG